MSTPPSPTKPRSPHAFRYTAAVTLCCTALLSLAAGAAIAVATMEPETVEVPGPVPLECQAALRAADSLMDNFERLGPLSSDSIGAAYRRDMAALETFTSSLQQVKEKYDADLFAYVVTKGTCIREAGWPSSNDS